MKSIKLTQDKYTKVDDGDFEILSKYKWHLHSMGYAARGVYNKETSKGSIVLMHRQIAHTPSDKHTDHKNGDKLDNRKSNLLVCDVKHNMRNRRGNKNTSSKFKGVHWLKPNNKWRAYITVDNRFKHLGLFEDESEAARCYNRAATKYFGNSARLNVC